MGIDYNNMADMSVEEVIAFLDLKRKQADIKREEIKKLRSAIESTKIKITEPSEKVEENIVINSNEEDSDFEEEVEYYLSEFLNLKDYSIESIEDVLPSHNNYNYERIVLRIMAEITHDIKDINEIIITDSSSMDKTELEEYKEELSTSLEKRSLLKKILFTKIDEEEDNIDRSNKLIFVPIKNSDKVRIFDEIKDVPEEEREAFIELFESIKNGTFKNIRRFVNNEALNGALEVKGYQVRILFQRLSKDCYAIISMFVKKTQNDSGYRNAIKQKYAEYKTIEKSLKESIQDPEFIKKNKEIEDEVFRLLSNDKNDDKGGVK